MDKAKLAELKDRLLEEKKNLLEEIKFIDEQGLNTAMDDSLSELSTYDNHPADIGTELFERSKDFALRERAMIDLVAVDNALNRIKNGNYGICDVCGEEIATERLEAKPSTTVCFDCKIAGEEQLPIHDRRPVEEDVLNIPFARSFTDDAENENVAYDGEDAWQEVARYSETTDEWSRGGSYYGYSDFDIVEDMGAVDEVDNIPYEVGEDGVIYRDFNGSDDEVGPQDLSGIEQG